MKTFEDYQDEMNPCYKDYEAFKNKSGAVCYIPENAEDLSEAFTYSDLMNEVVQWTSRVAFFWSEPNIDSLLLVRLQYIVKHILGCVRKADGKEGRNQNKGKYPELPFLNR